ncbi:MAG: DUF2058 domain-containing protein [Desulfobulbaceae bacterium]|nr:DUF2058 domain-containing protein [Desulfobulbaceae bacterium]
MGNSLSAQLLKAGLVNKKQVNKAKQEQYQTNKKQQGKGDAVAESKEMALKAQAAQKERARQLNEERRRQDAQKEMVAQIGQLIENGRIESGHGDLAYNFADGGKIKKIHLTKSIRGQLGKGQLAIVAHKGQYHVVTAEAARKIAELDAKVIIVLNKPQQAPAEDDPYAAFPIPDDLEW